VYLSTGSLVRTEGIFTSLVFDHALRIRMKASTSEKKPDVKPGDATGAGKSAAKGRKGGKDKSDSLVGRINSLITSDLSNITKGRDFLFISAISSSYPKDHQLNMCSFLCAAHLHAWLGLPVLDP
jgi:hypothetical protein